MMTDTTADGQGRRKRALLMLLAFLLLTAGWAWLRFDLLTTLLGLEGWSLLGGAAGSAGNTAMLCPIDWNGAFSLFLDTRALLAGAVCPIDPSAPFGALPSTAELARQAQLLGIKPSAGAPLGAYALMGVGGALLLRLAWTGSVRQRTALLGLLLLGGSRAATTGGARRPVRASTRRRAAMPKKAIAAIGIGSLAAIGVFAAVAPNVGGEDGIASDGSEFAVRQPRGGLPQDEGGDGYGGGMSGPAQSDDTGGGTPPGTQLADAGTGSEGSPTDDGTAPGDEGDGGSGLPGTRGPIVQGAGTGGETQPAGDLPGKMGEMPPVMRRMMPMMSGMGPGGSTPPPTGGTPGGPGNGPGGQGDSGTPGEAGETGPAGDPPIDTGLPQVFDPEVAPGFIEPIINPDDPLPTDRDPMPTGPDDKGDPGKGPGPNADLRPPTGDGPGDGGEPATTVAEPGALGLLGLGVVLLASRRRRARK